MDRRNQSQNRMTRAWPGSLQPRGQQLRDHFADGLVKLVARQTTFAPIPLRGELQLQ
jgi:hypothetical protein